MAYSLNYVTNYWIQQVPFLHIWALLFFPNAMQEIWPKRGWLWARSGSLDMENVSGIEESK
jgi:hypothetical protein